MTSWDGNIIRVTGPLCGEFTGLFCFFFVCALANGWANIRDAGDLRRHRAHSNVIEMVDFYNGDPYTWKHFHHIETGHKPQWKIHV